ncbi:sialin [Galendromus occidentalis]|uniref:Sialin n=1 Tax=Galendromus occidentalis TaxID=34638 RepID=A0AAJ6QTW4_9ACAR|nr:sialin [Galendromus occidentalis]
MKCSATQTEKPSVSEGSSVQYRRVLIVLAFFGAVCVYAMRVNMNVVIVSMVNHEAVRMDTKMSDCKLASTNSESAGFSPRNSTFLRNGPFAWSPKTQGVILGAFFWGYVITPIPGGFMAERYGGKWLFGLGVVLTGILGMLIPIVTTKFGHEGLIGIRALQGFCEGVTYPALEAQLAFWIPKSERCTAITCVHQGGFMGVVIGMLVSGKLAASDFLGGWPSVFYLFGGVTIVWFVLWVLLTSDKPEDHRFITGREIEKIRNGLSRQKSESRRPRLPLKSILLSAPVWAYVCTTFGFLYLQYTLITELPTYLGTVLHFDIGNNGVYSSLPYFGAIVTSAVAAMISDFLVKRSLLRVTTVRKLFNSIAMFGSSIVLMLVVTVAGCDGQMSLILFLIAGAIRGLAESSTGPIAIDMAPDFAGTIFGLTVTVGSFSGIIVPYVSGLLTNEVNSTTNWSYSFYVAGAVGILSGIVFLVFGSADLQPWAVEQNSSEECRAAENDLSLRSIGTAEGGDKK